MPVDKPADLLNGNAQRQYNSVISEGFLPPQGDRKPPHQPLHPSGKLREVNRYNLSFSVFFPSNSMVSITDITRRFRVRDFVIETWMFEGLIPQCEWRNGHRYWSSDDINALIAGCPITFPLEAASSIKKFTRRPAALNAVSSVIALIATLVIR